MPKKPTHRTVPLNPEQQAVVSFREGYCRVLAGPGSGKTTALVNRWVRLVRDGVSPDDILSLTFTKSAALNMRTRAEDLIGVQKMERTAGFITFHSLALSFCTQEREQFPFKLADFILSSEPQSNKIAGECARKWEIDPRRLRPWISLQKRNRVRAVDAVRQAEKDGVDEKLALAYKMYEGKMREAGMLDFDSLLFEMVNLLESNSGVRDRWQFRFVMSDESQDNSPLEWRLLQLLTEHHRNLLCVGDVAQGIYNFRGASGDLFLNMEEMFPNCQTLYLAKNHRSTKSIVRLCQQIGSVRELAERFHTDNPEGEPYTVIGYPSAADEAEAIVQKIDGTETAVLARTNRALRPVEDAFSMAGIKYYYLSKSGYWSQPEVKALIAHAQCVIYPSDAAVMTALRSPFWPTKFLRKKEIADTVKKQQTDDPNKPNAIKLLSEYLASDSNQTKAVGSFVHFLHTLTRYRNLPPTQVVKSLIQDLRAEDYYEEEKDIDNNPVENLQELVKIAARFPTLKEFLDYTRRVSAASKSKKGICLGTVHAAKGGEWDRVHLIAVNDGVLPHTRAESIEEERNIFFVGCSRPRKELHISYAGIPSKFLDPFIKKVDSLEGLFEETK